jgi:hypothetical protein
MIVVTAPWIEVRFAGWALVLAVQIFLYAKLRTTASTQHRPLIPLTFGPDLDWMAGECIVTILAGVVDAATPHLDRDDVLRLAVVSAAGLWVEAYPSHTGLKIGHRYRVEDR